MHTIARFCRSQRPAFFKTKLQEPHNHFTWDIKPVFCFLYTRAFLSGGCSDSIFCPLLNPCHVRPVLV
uniref:Uncharacterized protein n=1 Tax=Anguilla anguilla TaxID=7936 RepID=A0A0E9PX32_ANGAN